MIVLVGLENDTGASLWGWSRDEVTWGKLEAVGKGEGPGGYSTQSWVSTVKLMDRVLTNVLKGLKMS